MDALIYVLETGVRMLLLSAILWLVYVAVIRRKADYLLCRRFLLTLPFLCLLLPAVQFSLKRLPASGQPREWEMTETEARAFIPEITPGTAPTAVALGGKMLVSETSDYDRTIRIALGSVGAVSLFLVLLMGGQLLYLTLRCKRLARGIGRDEGLVRDRRIDTPFSFGGRIFLPANRLKPSDERLVVMHEKAHIRLGHSPEGLVMELCCRILWFNPFVWLARRELRCMQEYEADRQVLDGGADIHTYQTLLLEEAMKDSPVLTDGFNRSFVRRRFIEMKARSRRHCPPVYRSLAFLTAVCVTGILSAGSIGQRVVLKIVNEELLTSAPVFSVSSDTLSSVPETRVDETEKPVDETDKTAAETPEETEEKAVATADVTPDNRPAKAPDGWPILYDLPQVEGSSTRHNKVRMTHVGNETHLIFEHTVTQDDEFLKFGGPECYIVDTETGIHFQARRSIPAAAWNHFHLRGMKGKRIRVAVVFPRITASTDEIALYRVVHHLQSDERMAVRDILDK